MNGKTPAETALAADGGAGAALAAGLIAAARYILTHPGEPVPASVRADAHRALDTYAGSTRPGLAVAS